jgi:phage-related protein
MEPTKKLPARFYRNTRGHEPVREWLKSLTPAERQTIGKDMQKVELGWPLGLPVCRPLGEGLWEVRSDLSSRCTARVIFCIIAGQMILLHGFIKKTPQTPRRDLDIARVRKAETEQSGGEETQS